MSLKKASMCRASERVVGGLPAARLRVRSACSAFNKLDEADDRQTDYVERRIRSINPSAWIIRTVQADVPMDRMLCKAGLPDPGWS